MATGQVFKGFAAIRGLSARAISSREQTDELKMEAGNAFVSADGTMMCWEFLHQAIANKQAWTKEGPPEGTVISEPIVFVCDIKDGKIKSIREYFDMFHLMERPLPLYLSMDLDIPWSRDDEGIN